MHVMDTFFIHMDKEANITTDTLESVTTRLTHVMSCLDHDKGLCIYRMMEIGQL